MVIGITGTNGKSTSVAMCDAIFRAAGKHTAMISSVEFCINGRCEVNDTMRTMPGRWFISRFLTRARDQKVQYVFLEVTSEGIRQHRHRFIRFALTALTNVTPEHIESHGSFEKYKHEKKKLFAYAPVHVLNEDARVFQEFRAIGAREVLTYKKADWPLDVKLSVDTDFNRENALLAITIARHFGISDSISFRVLSDFQGVAGRMEQVYDKPRIVVDYANTPDALEKVYVALRANILGKLIGVFGAPGGGRDHWKREVLGKVADTYCDEIILTSDDSYDEDPASITRAIAVGITQHEPRIILDRREAITAAIEGAAPQDVIVISGMGSEPWLMGPNGKKTPWDDREVARRAIAHARAS